MSRHNISQAQQIFQGKANFPPYQTDKLGVEMTPLYRYKPTRSYSTTATGAIAAGAASCTLSGNWPAPTGFYTVTFSDTSQLQAFVTNGATTCVFYAAATPLTGNIPTATVLNAVTSALVFSGVPPVLGVANAYAASQTVTGAGTAFVLNGASSTGTPAVGSADIPRNVVAAWTNTAVLTITGTDFYGQTQTEVTASGTSWTGKKTFATITSVTTSATITGATVGTGNVLGLPFRAQSGDVLQAMFNDAVDAGTITVADQTTPATSSTGDVRGTYTPAGTLNGGKFLAILFKVGDTSTQYGAFGVTPA